MSHESKSLVKSMTMMSMSMSMSVICLHDNGSFDHRIIELIQIQIQT